MFTDVLDGKKLFLDVNDMDIDRGSCGDPLTCAVSHAIMAEFPMVDVRANYKEILISEMDMDCNIVERRYVPDQIVADFMNQYDLWNKGYNSVGVERPRAISICLDGEVDYLNSYHNRVRFNNYLGSEPIGTFENGVLTPFPRGIKPKGE